MVVDIAGHTLIWVEDTARCLISKHITIRNKMILLYTYAAIKLVFASSPKQTPPTKITSKFRIENNTCICRPSPSNQSFYRQIAGYQRGAGDHRVG
jgi:hypothetical protein